MPHPTLELIRRYIAWEFPAFSNDITDELINWFNGQPVNILLGSQNHSSHQAQSQAISHASVQIYTTRPSIAESGTQDDRHGSVEVGVNARLLGNDISVGPPSTSMASGSTETEESFNPLSDVDHGHLGGGQYSSSSRYDAVMWTRRFFAPQPPVGGIPAGGEDDKEDFIRAERLDPSIARAMRVYDREFRMYNLAVWRDEIYEPPLEIDLDRRRILC